MSDNSTIGVKKQLSQKEIRRKELEANRDEWKKKDAELIQEKIDLRYGDVSPDEFLNISIDEKSQAEADKILSLQKKLVEQKERWKLLWPEDAVVAELNQRHAMIHESKTQFLTEKTDHRNNTKTFSFENRQSLIDYYENQIVETSDGELKSKARIWLTHPKKRAFDGIVFDPKTLGHGRYYNIWRGFAVTISNQNRGSCQLFKAHIEKVICNSNQEHFSYVWKWLSHLVQHPDKIGTALLLMGSQGTGKGIFVKSIGKLFGSHFIHLDNLDHVVGNFNFHLRNAVLVFGDEALWGGNKKDTGRVKAMISEETAIIEPKGKDPYELPNFRHFIFASNDDWPIHLEKDQRRILALKVNEERKEDHDYFEKIDEELKNGGYEALLYELLHTDLTEFRMQKLPKNTEAFSVKLPSCTSAERYIYEALCEGNFDIGNQSPHGEWKTEVPTRAVYADYTTWCDKQREKIIGDAQFGTILGKLIPSKKKGRPRGGESRQNVYFLPILEKARLEFQKSFKVDESVWE